MRVPILIALLLTATAGQAQIVAGPLPATAAVDPPLVDSRGPRPETTREVRDIRRRVDRVRDKGALSRKQARVLKGRAGGIDALARRYARDGLSESEQRDLDAQTFILRDMVDLERLRTPAHGGRR